MVGGWRRAGVAEVARMDWAMAAESSVEAVRGRSGAHAASPTGSRDCWGERLGRCVELDPDGSVGIAGVEADTRMEKTRVEVHESDNHRKDDFAGQTCLPAWELRRMWSLMLRSVKLLMRFDLS
ncbi:hypothetical protein GUJ93_ZPchr0010g10400 [Zizania palustris]|uniref:Uncharacterized protein n=1 Tax=Zizania palustris TaxID=103762 RepID=A0A8J5W7I5_ZIZPA|nr:hypothetical protein GUJ93_ZPchr0010g10400 [Zizania palustris]